MSLIFMHILCKYDISCANMAIILDKVLLASQYGAHCCVLRIPSAFLKKICLVSFTAHHSSNENAHKDRLCGCCPRAIRYSGCPHTHNHTASLRVSHIPASLSYPSFGTIKSGGLIQNSKKYTCVVQLCQM